MNLGLSMIELAAVQALARLEMTEAALARGDSREYARMNLLVVANSLRDALEAGGIPVPARIADEQPAAIRAA